MAMTARPVRFAENPNFLKELTQDPATRRALDTIAGNALAGVQAAASAAELPNQYVDSFSIEEGAEGPELVTSSSLWALFEYGTVQSPPYAPIRRGFESAGVDMTDNGR